MFLDDENDITIDAYCGKTDSELKKFNRQKQKSNAFSNYSSLLEELQVHFEDLNSSTEKERLRKMAQRLRKRIEEGRKVFESQAAIRNRVVEDRREYREAHSTPPREEVHNRLNVLYDKRDVRGRGDPFIRNREIQMRYDSEKKVYYVEGDFQEVSAISVMVGMDDVDDIDDNDDDNGSDNEVEHGDDSDDSDDDNDAECENSNRDDEINEQNRRMENVNEEATTDMIELSGSFYQRNKRFKKDIKKIRNMVAKETDPRPKRIISNEKSYELRRLIMGNLFVYRYVKTFIDDDNWIVSRLRDIAQKTVTFDRKRYMIQAEDLVGKTKASDYFKVLTGENVSDGEMVALLNQYEESFRSKCDGGVVRETICSKITRDGVEKSEVVSTNFVSSVVVSMMKKSTHIMYIDACHCSDHGCILLAIFMDGNHKVQPIGFQISPTENSVSWCLFLRALLKGGVEFNDLVILSDRGESIAKAVEEVYPEAEHSFCMVHLERNIQGKWEKENTPLSLEEEENVKLFNKYMNYYTEARLSIDADECKGYINKMKAMERTINKDSLTPVTDYITSIDGVMMYKWKYCHLMEETTNPIEICMKELMSPRYGLKPCRDGSMLNKVRYLIRWMYERVETRYKALDCDHRIPVSTSFKVPCKWVEKYIISLCHQYQEYHDQFRISDANGNRDALTNSRMYLFE